MHIRKPECPVVWLSLSYGWSCFIYSQIILLHGNTQGAIIDSNQGLIFNIINTIPQTLQLGPCSSKWFQSITVSLLIINHHRHIPSHRLLMTRSRFCGEAFSKLLTPNSNIFTHLNHCLSIFFVLLHFGIKVLTHAVGSSHSALHSHKKPKVLKALEQALISTFMPYLKGQWIFGKGISPWLMKLQDLTEKYAQSCILVCLE